MSAPMPVVIVRPKKTTQEKVTAALVALAALAGNAWLLMLILGAISPWHPAYWQSVLVIMGVRSLQRQDYLAWTREPTR